MDISNKSLLIFALMLSACGPVVPGAGMGSAGGSGSAASGSSSSSLIERGEVPVSRTQFIALMDCLTPKLDAMLQTGPQVAKSQAAKSDDATFNLLNRSPIYYMPYKKAIEVGCKI